MSFSSQQQLTPSQNSDSKNYLDSKTTALVKPKSTKGISGYVFDIMGNENLNVSADITDNYVESGTFLNDHIVRKPEKITLSGYVGENVFINQGVEGQLEELTNKLELVDAYLGDFTPGMVQSIQLISSQADFAESSINQFVDKIKNPVDLFEGESDSESRQQESFKNIYALFNMNTVLTCQTPWKYYESVMITSISATQNEETNQISDMSVTLKEIRMAGLEFVNFNENLFPPRVVVQAEEVQEAGTVKGDEGDYNSTLLDIEEGRIPL